MTTYEQTYAINLKRPELGPAEIIISGKNFERNIPGDWAYLLQYTNGKTETVFARDVKAITLFERAIYENLKTQ